MTNEKRQYNGVKVDFSTNGHGTAGHLQQEQQKNLDTYHIPFTKANSKWIIELNAKCKT